VFNQVIKFLVFFFYDKNKSQKVFNEFYLDILTLIFTVGNAYISLYILIGFEVFGIVHVVCDAKVDNNVN